MEGLRVVDSATQLDQSARGSDYRVGIVLHSARGCVWFTRRILGLLMRIGHGISCFMLRQMEYDADYCEISIAGSEAFESTVRRLHILSYLLETSYKDMRVSWNVNKHLPENFPAYLLQHDRQLSAQVRTGLEDRILRIRSGRSPASTPMPRTAHLIGTILPLEPPSAGRMRLRSTWACHVFFPRSGESHAFFGRTEHELALRQGHWRIARKKIILQNDYIPAMLDVYCV